jgi:hypothetical protein
MIARLRALARPVAAVEIWPLVLLLAGRVGTGHGGMESGGYISAQQHAQRTSLSRDAGNMLASIITPPPHSCPLPSHYCPA